jgi:hypothetical protein
VLITSSCGILQQGRIDRTSRQVHVSDYAATNEKVFDGTLEYHDVSQAQPTKAFQAQLTRCG